MSDRKCWAFLVGINKYKGYTRLRYCVQDVQTLEILLDNVGYVPVCLHDYLVPDHPRYPSRVNILHELEALLDNVNTQDLLLVYFACH
ncbi:MAG: caspase family protein, partial [Cyanobacteria bacterium P01_E01_bin.6]